MRRPSKVKDILRITSESATKGSILYSSHANVRMLERGLVKPKIEYILKQGHHEARKDRFNNEHSSWDYAIKGKTVDGKILRVVVALIEPNVDRTKRICDNSN